MTAPDRIADINNKLSPFWTLSEMVIHKTEIVEKLGEGRYNELLQATAVQSERNKELITEQLKELAKK